MVAHNIKDRWSRAEEGDSRCVTLALSSCKVLEKVSLATTRILKKQDVSYLKLGRQMCQDWLSPRAADVVAESDDDDTV